MRAAVRGSCLGERHGRAWRRHAGRFVKTIELSLKAQDTADSYNHLPDRVLPQT